MRAPRIHPTAPAGWSASSSHGPSSTSPARSGSPPLPAPPPDTNASPSATQAPASRSPSPSPLLNAALAHAAGARSASELRSSASASQALPFPHTLPAIIGTSASNSQTAMDLDISNDAIRTGAQLPSRSPLADSTTILPPPPPRAPPPPAPAQLDMSASASAAILHIPEAGRLTARGRRRSSSTSSASSMFVAAREAVTGTLSKAAEAVAGKSMMTVPGMGLSNWSIATGRDLMDLPTWPPLAGSGPRARRNDPLHDPWAARVRAWRLTVHKILTKPSASQVGMVFSWLFLATVMLSVCLMVAESDSAASTNPARQQILYTLELVTSIFFTAEYVLRIVTWPSTNARAFLSSILNWTDGLALLPFWLGLSLGGPTAAVMSPGRSGQSTVIGAWRILTLGRVLRLFKVIRHSKQLRLAYRAFRKSRDGILMLLFIFALALAFFSSLIFFAESQACAYDDRGVLVYTWPENLVGVNCAFQSILDGMWWCIVTITTTGYGDVVPKTVYGKLVAAVTMLCAVMMFSFPITIFSQSLADVYREHRQHQATMKAVAHKLRERRAERDAAAAAAAAALDASPGRLLGGKLAASVASSINFTGSIRDLAQSLKATAPSLHNLPRPNSDIGSPTTAVAPSNTWLPGGPTRIVRDPDEPPSGPARRMSTGSALQPAATADVLDSDDDVATSDQTHATLLILEQCFDRAARELDTVRVQVEDLGALVGELRAMAARHAAALNADHDRTRAQNRDLKRQVLAMRRRSSNAQPPPPPPGSRSFVNLLGAGPPASGPGGALAPTLGGATGSRAPSRQGSTGSVAPPPGAPPGGGAEDGGGGGGRWNGMLGSLGRRRPSFTGRER
ncbi:hypothetical protein AMAG_20304 [Allomyces macrogynus ATCC 38327]|uniref:Ion transport domain-containing protein n=1 Tax=Allomyces macrogynus (strain ATCC 38327) TaxID=578462 RepID=A0A0L0T774_ALLM3|nr:hypothetical protein AMAG_20304 [Allomyces macrogynus ATCC 38327]|eukprot:KNE70658.1 hypothetical protein AMAG_20304 [Allomyces macrogynus ATCC 38327]